MNLFRKSKLSQSSPDGKRNPWVVGWIGMVAVVVLVNIGMVTTAFITRPALVDEDYYETGRKYEQNAIKMLVARNELGWEGRLDVPPKTFMNMPVAYNFNVVDKEGLPLKGADVMLFAYRSSDADEDFKEKLSEIAPGLYQGTMNFRLKGIWDLSVQVKRDEHRIDFTRRITVISR